VAVLNAAPLTVNATVYVPGSRPTVPNTKERPWLIGCPLTDHRKPNSLLSPSEMDALTCAVSPGHSSLGVALTVRFTFRFGQACRQEQCSHPGTFSLGE